MKKIFVTLMFVGGLCLSMIPQNSRAQDGLDRSAFWGNQEKYLFNQAFKMFDLVDEGMDEFPPVVGASTERKLVLYNLDAMLHETKYDLTEPMNRFVASRLNKAIADLSAPLKKGMRVYKIYNEGMVVRTPSVTLAFDIARGNIKGKRVLPAELVQQIVDKCDIMFLTHNHGDHVDASVVDMFVKAGKPVVAPTNIQPDNKGITHERSTEMIDKEMTIGNDKHIQVKIFPGYQDDLMNNIYVVTTPEKKVFAHVGDQYNKEDMDWIVNIKERIPQPHVLLVNCWTHRMNDFINGFNPRYVVTGHENEMGHTIDHREAFWFTFEKMEKMDNRNYVVMGWGEWFTCK